MLCIVKSRLYTCMIVSLLGVSACIIKGKYKICFIHSSHCSYAHCFLVLCHENCNFFNQHIAYKSFVWIISFWSFIGQGSYDALKVFSWQCFPCIRDYNYDKFDTRFVECDFLDYALHKKGVFVSRQILWQNNCE